MAVKIKKIRCPACENRRGISLLGLCCSWCGGTGRASVETALRYADLTWCFAGGGYIAGDYSLEECRAEEAKAKCIAALVGDPDRF